MPDDSRWNQWTLVEESQPNNGQSGKRKLTSAGSSPSSWEDGGPSKFGRLEISGEVTGDIASNNEKPGSEVNTWHHVEDLASKLTAEFDGNFPGLDEDLNSESYSLNDALLGIPSLAVFKEETLSPNQTQHQNENSNSRSTEDISEYHQTSPFHDSDSNSTHLEELASLCNEVSSTGSPSHNLNGIEEIRVQYTLGAATSIATKMNEESLTYLNQGQSYEIKFKKLEARHCSSVRGKLLKSIIRVSFHDRRLQYTEREQMSLWRASRPGDRILEVDLPLSYGLMDLVQDNASFTSVQFYWDPSKDVGVYIKVNCISTEFTPKKHGGEKGVPFRIQVDTFAQDSHHLHSASCQIKVFKLKGADRKHKQDKEKILKRPHEGQSKYQQSYDYTVLTEVQYSTDNLPINPCLSMSPQIVDSSDVGQEPSNFQIVPNISSNEIQKSHNNGDLNDYQDGLAHFKRDFCTSQVQSWLKTRDFSAYMVTFANYNGVDMLLLSRDDLKALCGLSEGIRLFNSIHPELLAHKRTLYILMDTESMVYHPIFLYKLTSSEMCSKLIRLLGVDLTQGADFYVQGPNNIHVVITDELVNHIKDESMFSVDIMQDMNGSNHYQLLLKPIASNFTSQTAPAEHSTTRVFLQ